MSVRRRARAPRPAAVSGACDGCDAEGDLGSVAALLEVLHPALDLFDMTPDARQLALDGARVPHAVGPVLQIQERLVCREQVSLARLRIHILLGDVLP